MSALARAMGMVPQSLQRYTREKNPLPIKATMRERLASVGLTSEYIRTRLEGHTPNPPLPSVPLVKIPVYESVSAGTKGNLIMDDPVEYIAVQKSGDDTQFGVVVKGESMSPRVNGGDMVVVSQRAEVRSGDLAIVFWNDGDSALRVVTFSGENVTLSSANPSKYPPMIIAKSHVHRMLRVMMRVEKF